MKYIIGILTAVILFFSSCDKEEGKIYSEGSMVNFESIKNQDYFSLKLSFGELPFSTQKITCNIPVSTMGNFSGKDRTYGITIDKELSTAPENSYEALSDTYIIEADSLKGVIPITFNRANIKGEEDYILVIKINENGDLKPGVIESKSFRIEYNNYLAKPDWWDQLSAELGAYQQEKYQKYLEIYGEPIQGWQVSYMRYQVLKKFKVVKEFFDANPQYGVTFPDGSWGV
jgi:hypothetical protein